MIIIETQSTNIERSDVLSCLAYLVADCLLQKYVFNTGKVHITTCSTSVLITIETRIEHVSCFL